MYLLIKGSKVVFLIFQMSLLLTNLVLLLLALHPAVAVAAVGDGAQHHQRQSLYPNVFFSELPTMKGRPSTSFVMVRIITIISRLVLKVKMYLMYLMYLKSSKIKLVQKTSLLFHKQEEEGVLGPELVHY